MKKLLLMVCCAGWLSGCASQEMSNEKIIEECKKCSDAGLNVNIMRFAGSGSIIRVECLPKEYQGDKR